jgi:hypothetical protein
MYLARNKSSFEINNGRIRNAIKLEIININTNNKPNLVLTDASDFS